MKKHLKSNTYITDFILNTTMQVSISLSFENKIFMTINSIVTLLLAHLAKDNACSFQGNLDNHNFAHTIHDVFL